MYLKTLVRSGPEKSIIYCLNIPDVSSISWNYSNCYLSRKKSHYLKSNSMHRNNVVFFSFETLNSKEIIT